MKRYLLTFFGTYYPMGRCKTINGSFSNSSFQLINALVSIIIPECVWCKTIDGRECIIYGVQPRMKCDMKKRLYVTNQQK